MFLIVPPGGNEGTNPRSTTASAVVTPYEQPEETRARTRKACNRCRLKKTKCNGRIPCAKCERDHATCRADVGTADVQQLSRSYISSLEAQQVSLLTALRELHCRDPNNIAIRDTIEQLQRKGFDVNSLKYQDNNKVTQSNQSNSGYKSLEAGPSSMSWDCSHLTVGNLESLLAQPATPQAWSDMMCYFSDTANSQSVNHDPQQDTWAHLDQHFDIIFQNNEDTTESSTARTTNPWVG